MRRTLLTFSRCDGLSCVFPVALCNAPEYRSRPPAFIVADQADKGRYLASESTMYRVLHEVDQQHHRGRQQAPQRKRPPTTHQATAPNRLWCWDIARHEAPWKRAVMKEHCR